MARGARRSCGSTAGARSTSGADVRCLRKARRDGAGRDGATIGVPCPRMRSCRRHRRYGACPPPPSAWWGRSSTAATCSSRDWSRGHLHGLRGRAPIHAARVRAEDPPARVSHPPGGAVAPARGARMLGAVHHPNVVEVIDAGRMRRPLRRDQAPAREVGRGVAPRARQAHGPRRAHHPRLAAAALAATHEARVIHRDISQATCSSCAPRTRRP